MGNMNIGDGSDLDFTTQAKRHFIRTVKDPYFRDNDLDLIYDLLKNRINVVPFGDYLKRYIYEKAQMSGNYRDIPLSEYLDIVCEEFHDRQVPCSFSPTTTKLRNAAKNWLEQQSVNRSVVLLLGFGLGMSLDDVNSFLNKALQDPELDAKDPLEAICWFCYNRGFLYPKFEALWNEYLTAKEEGRLSAEALDSTMGCRESLRAVKSEKELVNYLLLLPVAQGTKRQSKTARKHFDSLYQDTREQVAAILTETEIDSADKGADRVEERLNHNDTLYDYQKLEMIKKEKEKYRSFTADDISPADVENVILCAIPKDKNGNLASMKVSSLNRQFAGKRLSRQHLGEILSGKAPITRFDLITLNFFIISRKEFDTRRDRYTEFIDSTNQILMECNMGSIYVANPYECFLLMCVLSDDPLGTYSDVWELSFDGEK